MSQLIQIRQHIKAIETIKKITHAMRLISMSTHSQLKQKDEPLRLYTSAIHDLFYRLMNNYLEWENPILQPNKTETEHHLVILIGSQKGLCGSFNNSLFSIFKKKKSIYPLSTHYVIIGKKAIDFVHSLDSSHIIKTYPTFTNSTRNAITHDIVQLLTSTQKPYTHVTVFSNQLKTFFTQKTTTSTIIPLGNTSNSHSQKNDLLDYTWEQDPKEILTYLGTLYLESTLNHLLFQSLFAEHAARFISMDTATRNAENILIVTKLKHNKLRQAKITKELTELTGSNF